MKTENTFILATRWVMCVGLAVNAGVFFVAILLENGGASLWGLFLLVMGLGYLPYWILMDHSRKLVKRNAPAISVLVLLVTAVILVVVTAWLFFDLIRVVGGESRGCRHAVDLLYTVPVLQNVVALIAAILSNILEFFCKLGGRWKQREGTLDAGGVHSDDAGSAARASRESDELISWRRMVVESVLMVIWSGYLLIVLVNIVDTDRMRRLVLYWAPPVGLVIWLFLMWICLLESRPPKRNMIWLAFRCAVVAVFVAAIGVCFVGVRNYVGVGQ